MALAGALMSGLLHVAPAEETWEVPPNFHAEGKHRQRRRMNRHASRDKNERALAILLFGLEDNWNEYQLFSVLRSSCSLGRARSSAAEYLASCQGWQGRRERLEDLAEFQIHDF